MKHYIYIIMISIMITTSLSTAISLILKIQMLVTTRWNRWLIIQAVTGQQVIKSQP